jgi:hypothetical protein
MRSARSRTRCRLTQSPSPRRSNGPQRGSSLRRTTLRSSWPCGPAGSPSSPCSTGWDGTYLSCCGSHAAARSSSKTTVEQSSCFATSWGVLITPGSTHTCGAREGRPDGCWLQRVAVVLGHPRSLRQGGSAPIRSGKLPAYLRNQEGERGCSAGVDLGLPRPPVHPDHQAVLRHSGRASSAPRAGQRTASAHRAACDGLTTCCDRVRR